MGFLWSFERGGWFSQAPSTNSVFVQAFSNSQWDLAATNWNYGTNLLAARFQEYRNSLAFALTNETPDSAAVNGNGSGEYVVDALPGFESAFDSFVMFLLTMPANTSTAPQTKVRSLALSANDESNSTNIPAYAWIRLTIPSNAVSMSFDYKIQGDWNDDSLAVAFNGTNVLLLAGSGIETNVLFSSGSIDVSTFAGQTNEFFIGIVGGTSTNAQLTLQDMNFYSLAPPLLQAQLFGSSFVVIWPLSTRVYALETTDNLATANSWTTVTNIPAIVNFQNTVTNEISGTSRFYRLIMR